MKKYLPLFFVAGLMVACNGQDTTDSTTDTAHIEEAPSTGKVPVNTDSFSVGNKSFTIYPLEHSSFEKLGTPDYDSAEYSLLIDDKDRVKRVGDSLIFTLSNGKTSILANNTKEENDQYSIFFYAGYLPGIHQYLAYGGYYESSDYVLINADNGEITHVWGIPAVSPDHKYVICASIDLVAGVNVNGFQLFSYRGNKLIPEGDVQFDKWGPGQMKWLDNKTIEAEYVVLDKDMNEVPKPVKLVMK
jgi:hypothetical protein